MESRPEMGAKLADRTIRNRKKNQYEVYEKQCCEWQLYAGGHTILQA